MNIYLSDEWANRCSSSRFIKIDVYGLLLNNVRLLLTEGHISVVTVRTDNAKEYQSTQKELMDMGVTIEFTSTYTAYQNGIAERFNRTVITLARSRSNYTPRECT